LIGFKCTQNVRLFDVSKRSLGLIIIVSTLVIFIWSSASIAASCKPLSLEDDGVRVAWAPAHFSNPREHNSQKFRYIIHAIREDSYVRLFENPELLSNLTHLPMSVIDEAHRGLFSKSGFILSVPEQNIIFTSPRDVGSPVGAHPLTESKLAAIESRRREFGIRDPSEILENTKGHNEILAWVNLESGGQIAITGIFVRTNTLSDGSKTWVVSRERGQEIKRLAHKMNLPIVEIESMPRDSY
jgi:hypothetical protein